MKYLFTLLALFSLNFYANAAKSIEVKYAVVSDSVVSDVPKGFCRVKGQVTNYGMPLSAGLVANYEKSNKTTIDKSGMYELLIPDSDSIIFFFSKGYSEIVINPYNFKSGHEVIIDFYAVYNLEQVICEKPVIYLYSEKKINANLQLNFIGDLEFTYPKYNNGWQVSIDEVGIKEQTTDKSFPYLFWEGAAENLDFEVNNNTIEGFIIHTDTVIAFLENQLTIMGLNRSEQTDFITYWAPRMIETDFALVQFLVDDTYAESIAALKIEPKPDNIKRIYMLFMPSEVKPVLKVKPQLFIPISNGLRNRSGFTVIEWGGSQLSINQENL